MLQVAEGCRALLLAQQGQESRAIAWLRGAPPPPMIPQYMFHCPLLVGPRILLAEGSADSLAEAAERLDTLVPYFRRLHNVRFLVEALGLRAWLLHLRGDAAGARQALGEAVRLALPGGLVRALADLGPALHPLLDGLAADGQLRPFIERIRRAGGRGAARAPVGQETATASALTEPLTRREREVLQLLGHRLSNKEIADRLFVSAATVKRHTENLYAKLGVEGRRQAVDRARQLRLLDDGP
jgi:LuxR family maltose regulon positive regulatory protein